MALAAPTTNPAEKKSDDPSPPKFLCPRRNVVSAPYQAHCPHHWPVRRCHASFKQRWPFGQAPEGYLGGQGIKSDFKFVENLCALQSTIPSPHLLSGVRLIIPDCRVSFAYRRPIHLDTPRQDKLPDHNLGRPIATDLRPAPRSQSRLRDQAPNPRRHHSHFCLEGKGIRSMGWLAQGRISGYMGLPEGPQGG